MKIALYILFILSLPAHAKTDGPPPGTLRLVLPTEPPTLDWNKSTDAVSNTVIENIMEGLLSADWNKPGAPLAPALAKSWKAKNNGRTWIFTLRSGVQWSDGVGFTAQQVVDSWKRLLAPETASENGHLLLSVKGAKDFHSGIAKDFSKVGIRALDPLTVEVELEKPVAYFPYLAAFMATFPVRTDLLAKFGDRWTEAGNLVSTGPFRLKSWAHDKEIFLERNENYYGKPATLKAIQFYIVPEITTAHSLFESGKVDALTSVSSFQLPKLKNSTAFHSQPNIAVTYLGFNTSKAPFDRVKFRQAISYALDRSEIAKILGGGQRPTSGWLPPGFAGYHPGAGQSFNVEKAKELLRQEGFGPGLQSLPKIELASNGNEDNQRLLENVQSQLRKNLGLETSVKLLEWKVYLAAIRQSTPDLFRMGWFSVYPDSDGHMNLFTSYSENNRLHWKNAEYDHLIESAASEMSTKKRHDLYRKAHDLLLGEAPIIPLVGGVTNELIAPRVKNFPLNPFSRYLFKDVELTH